MKNRKAILVVPVIVIVLLIGYFEYVRRTYIVDFDKVDTFVGVYYSCSKQNMFSRELIERILHAPLFKDENMKGVAATKSEYSLDLAKSNGFEYQLQFFNNATTPDEYIGVISVNGNDFRKIVGTAIEKDIEIYCNSKS